MESDHRIGFKEHARRTAYQRIGLVLIPISLLLTALFVYLAVQVVVGQQRRVVSALAQTISSNVINGDSFQLRSLAVSAVQSGLFGGIEISAQGQTIVSVGQLAHPTMWLPMTIGGTGLDVAQRMVLDIISDGSVIVSNHYAWLPIAAIIMSVGFLVWAIVTGTVRVCEKLVGELTAPLTGLAKAISNASERTEPDAPCGQRFIEVDDVWNRHLSVVNHLRRFMAGEAEAQKNAAVASMTGMLAHDVRKPFSILRMGLGMLGKAKDPAAVKRILAALVPEIDKAVSSVDGLIADVMEVGSTSTQLIQEPASPESFIEATLGEAFRIYPKADIAIAYDLRHSHMVNVHVQKVGRVFSNIVGNAVQAMGYKGDIWFKTRERDGQIEFCLGNAGSVIPTESLPKLFDAFFTSGKKGGTGLGLAIAQKVVTAHGGRIWCDSSKTMEHPDGKVEFFFTLPVAEGARTRTSANLPKHSAEIAKAIAAMTAAAEVGEGSVDKGELTLEADIVHASEKLGRALRVLVVDDEAVYRGGLAAYLSRTLELEAAIALVQADGSDAAIGAVATGSFDLVITDVDMGHDSLDGFELVRNLRADGNAAMVCVHSNRIIPADHKRAIEAGADAFMPKPMARAQFIRLVLQAAGAAIDAAAEPSIETVPARQGAEAADRPQLKLEIAVIDDNPFILDAWEDVLKADAIVHVFNGLEDLADRLEADPEFGGRLIAAITDMHLDGSAGDGLDVGRLLKKSRPDLPVLLSSDGIFAADELIGAVDRVISKNPVPLRALELA